MYPIVDNCVFKDFYPADRLIHDITLALMATQTTEGGGWTLSIRFRREQEKKKAPPALR
ncbi:MAG: hypothetical protein IKG87_05315 [Clostridia bacterium]|nr:hypothetical protein [Clostridia bacterium]